MSNFLVISRKSSSEGRDWDGLSFFIRPEMYFPTRTMGIIGSWWGLLYSFAFEDSELKHETASLSWKTALKFVRENWKHARKDWASENVRFAAARLVLREKALGSLFVRRALYDFQKERATSGGATKIIFEFFKGDIGPAGEDSSFWGVHGNPWSFSGQNYLGRLSMELAADIFLAMNQRDEGTFDLSFPGMEKIDLTPETLLWQKDSTEFDDPATAGMREKLRNIMGRDAKPLSDLKPLEENGLSADSGEDSSVYPFY